MSENLKRMREALQFIPAHDRDIWVKMGMAIKSELGDEGYSIWETWSARGESYDSKAAKSVWQSIRASGNTTVKSLFHEAKGFGWRDDAYYAGILHSALNSTAAIHPESAPIALEADAKREAGQLHAAIKATSIWQASKPAPDDHPYLVRKGIKAHGARFHNGALVIPLRDGTALHSLQFIGKDGSKRFLTDGRVKGCYTSIGTTKDATVICIVEGFATGATIHESTGHPVAVALNAGNLGAVAMAIRAKYPDMPIIVCADDDTATIGNPGLSKANLAASAVGGRLAIPAFGEIKPNEATDFNDMAAHCGVEAVKQAVAGATAVADVVHQAAGDEASKAGLAPDMPHGRVVTLMSAHEIAPEPIQWLWEGWLAEGKFHILGGAPGTGKTTLALALAATISCMKFCNWSY